MPDSEGQESLLGCVYNSFWSGVFLFMLVFGKEKNVHVSDLARGCNRCGTGVRNECCFSENELNDE